MSNPNASYRKTSGIEPRLSTEQGGRHFWLLVGSVCSFFSVYFLSIIYTLVPNVLHVGVIWTQSSGISNSFIYTANATMTTGTTMTFMPIIIIVLVGMLILSLLLGSFSISKGLGD